jgi:hypothetical protein
MTTDTPGIDCKPSVDRSESYATLRHLQGTVGAAVVGCNVLSPDLRAAWKWHFVILSKIFGGRLRLRQGPSTINAASVVSPLFVTELNSDSVKLKRSVAAVRTNASAEI